MILTVLFMMGSVCLGSGLVISPDIIEIGELEENSSKRFEFSVSNSSSEMLNVKLKSSCGCTVLGGKEVALGPGQKSLFYGVFSSKGLQGLVTRYVYASVDNVSPIRIPVRAFVFEEYTLDQTSWFIPRTGGNPVEFDLALYSKKHIDFTLKKIECNFKALDVSFQKVKDQEKGTYYTIHLVLNPQKIDGQYIRENLLFHLDPEPEKAVSIEVHGYK